MFHSVWQRGSRVCQACSCSEDTTVAWRIFPPDSPSTSRRGTCSIWQHPVEVDSDLANEKTSGPEWGRMRRFKDSTTGSAVVSKDARELQEVVDVDFVILVDVRVASAAAVLAELAQEEQQVVDRDDLVAVDVAEAAGIIALVRDAVAVGVLAVAVGDVAGVRDAVAVAVDDGLVVEAVAGTVLPVLPSPSRPSSNASIETVESSPFTVRRAMRTPSRFEQSLAMNCWALPCSSSGSTYQVPLLTSSVPPFSNWVQLMPTLPRSFDPNGAPV